SDVADHVLEERGRFDTQLDQLAGRQRLDAQRQLANLAHRRPRVTVRRPQRGEIDSPDQMRQRFPHRSHVQGPPHLPCSPTPKSRAAASATAAWTLGPFGCTCQPTNGAPSYSRVSFSTTYLGRSTAGWTLRPRSSSTRAAA